MKFGGSSVANAERIRHVAKIVQSYLDRKPIVVLSAMGDTTDHLLEAGDAALNKGLVHVDRVEDLHFKTIMDLELGDVALRGLSPLLLELQNLLLGISLTRELTYRTKDYLVSFGERLSVRIVAAYLASIGINAKAVDAWDAGFLSDSNFTRASLAEKSWKLIPEKLSAPAKRGIVQVVTGFIAKDEKANITTLGRGGSDLSAAMIAAACRAEELQVWKDVDGILTADPRIVKEAKPVKAVTYEAASELAYFGAQVLHPRAMQPCMRTGTPVVVKNSYNLDAPGTRIVESLTEKLSLVQAITFRKNVTLVDIVSSNMLGQSGFLDEVFSCFARFGISIDMIATSEVSISVTLDASYDLKRPAEELSKIANVNIKKGRAIVTIIGDVAHSSEILARTFKTCELLKVEVQMVSQGASKVNISIVVDDDEAEEMVKALHKNFFKTRHKAAIKKTGGAEKTKTAAAKRKK